MGASNGRTSVPSGSARRRGTGATPAVREVSPRASRRTDPRAEPDEAVEANHGEVGAVVSGGVSLDDRSVNEGAGGGGDDGALDLTTILRSLPESGLEGLIRRVGIRIDSGKRIDAASQTARALVGLPEVRDPSRLPSGSRELLHRIAEEGGMLLVPSLPAGLEPLVARGIVFARKTGEAVELVLPSAFVVQLPLWEGEDPRSLRALLCQAPLETLASIASHYLGRPSTPPIALSLEAAWAVLSNTERLRREVEALPPVEQRLLSAVEGVGGEVDTEELLDLEREPMRLRGATGVAASRRGAGFALERRAFLFPVHPNRHVVPTEVSRIVGEARRRAGEQLREQIRVFVLEEDHVPRRARFALDPGPISVAMAIAAREPGIEVREGVGTPRSLLTRLSARFGRPPEAVALIVALSRAIGLWDGSALSPSAPPGVLPIAELARALFAAWRRGGAWDEARPEREMLRVPAEHRDASPSRVLREMVLEAMRDLGEGSWVPWTSLLGYLAADPRLEGIDRLLRRWAERSGISAPQSLEIMRAIVLETLPALGVLDLGGGGGRDLNDDAGSAGPDAGDPQALHVRLTPRGRALLTGATSSQAPSTSRFVDTQALRVGGSAQVADVLRLSLFAELGRVEDHLDLVLTPQSIARALSVGVDGDSLRSRIEAVAALPSSISQMLVQASAVVGRASLVSCSAFLWVDDPDVRELLRTRRATADLFADPSPPSGLLVLPDVDVERLVRRCRGLGVEVASDGTVLRVRSPSQPIVGAVSSSSGRGSSARSATRPRSCTPAPRKAKSGG
jgi:hypothetical protein